jgi:hypothetical protein
VCPAPDLLTPYQHAVAVAALVPARIGERIVRNLSEWHNSPSQRLREFLPFQSTILALDKELVCVAPRASLLPPVSSLRVNVANPPDAGAWYLLEYPPVGLPCPRAPANERRWYVLPGFPPHKLRRFPDRLLRMADDIEKLNKRIQSDGVFRAAVELLPVAAKATVPESRNIELRGLDKLPELMRHYGDYIAALDRLVALFAPKAVTRDKAMRVELAEAARKLTGKPHYEEVAALLTAAYAALGSDEIVDSRALQMQHMRLASCTK